MGRRTSRTTTNEVQQQLWSFNNISCQANKQQTPRSYCTCRHQRHADQIPSRGRGGAPSGICAVDSSATTGGWFSTRSRPDVGTASFFLTVDKVGFLSLPLPLPLSLLSLMLVFVLCMVPVLVANLFTGERPMILGCPEINPSV